MNNLDLKTCPFCGRIPKYVKDKSQPNWENETYELHSIVCDCGIKAGSFNKKETAIKIWNRRVD